MADPRALPERYPPGWVVHGPDVPASLLVRARNFAAATWPRGGATPATAVNKFVVGEQTPVEITVDPAVSLADQIAGPGLYLPVSDDAGRVLPWATRLALLVYQGALMITNEKEETSKVQVLTQTVAMLDGLPPPLKEEWDKELLPSLWQVSGTCPVEEVNPNDPRFPLFWHDGVRSEVQ